jgi:hypothetical protein
LLCAFSSTWSVRFPVVGAGTIASTVNSVNMWIFLSSGQWQKSRLVCESGR